MTDDVQLETLEAKGLIKLATLRPELEYLFRHALVQDAAYGSLLKQERRELHGRVGEILEELYPERREELAPVLAMHFQQAGEREKAIDYYVEGGRHAIEGNAIQEGYAAFDQAANLIAEEGAAGEATPDQRRRRVEVALGRVRAGYSFMDMDNFQVALEAIIPEAVAVGDPQLEFQVHLLIALGRLQAGGTPDEPHTRRSLDRIAEIGEATGDPSMRATPLALIGLAQVFTGPVKEGVKALEEAVPLLQNGRDSIGAAFARGGLAMGYATLGEFDKADAAVKVTREAAEKADLIAQLDALIAESMVRAAEGRLDQAVPLARECVDRAEQTGASACVIASSWVLGDAFHRQGRFAEARDALARGADVAAIVDRRGWRPTLQAWLDTSTAALGEVTDEGWDEALETARSVRNHLGAAGIQAKRAEARATSGDIDGAVADFAAATSDLESEGARPALARVLRAWGEALLKAGRDAEAELILARSIATFTELGLTAEADGVRALRAIGGTKLAFD